MKKSDLIKCITQMQSNIPVALLSKTDFPKKKLEELYKRLVNGEKYADLLDENFSRKKSNRKSKPEKKKPVKIIEFSSDSEQDDTEETKAQPPTVEKPVKVEEPKVVSFVEPVAQPVVEKKPKLNKIKVKKEIKQLLLPFLKEIKDLLFEYKGNRDKDFLLDGYNLLLRDQEELYEEYLNTIDAPDEIYNYTADLLSVHTNKIERIVNS
jgi:hypothetical protein